MEVESFQFQILYIIIKIYSFAFITYSDFWLQKRHQTYLYPGLRSLLLRSQFLPPDQELHESDPLVPCSFPRTLLHTRAAPVLICSGTMTLPPFPCDSQDSLPDPPLVSSPELSQGCTSKPIRDFKWTKLVCLALCPKLYSLAAFWPQVPFPQTSTNIF